MSKRSLWLLLLCTLLVLMPVTALGSETVYRIETAEGEYLTSIAGECDAGDEYFSGDDRHYRIAQVDEESKVATAEYIGQTDLPDVSWLTGQDAAAVSAVGRKLIALYCTHSDESYIDGDGTESDEEKGGIYDIAGLFAGKLKELGATIEKSDETHHPHDAGAYRRSRQTALALLKKQPNAIFDLHRDGIPDPEEYAVKLGGKAMSKVRLLVGKSNQNKDANLSFAKQIKAVADKMYPGLIKDIYMGKGTYNQDLAPRSVLLEFGTHTLPKERVEASTGPMAEVVYRTLFGGVVGSAGSSDVSSGKAAPEEKPATESNEGAGAGVWIIVALVLGLGVFAFLSAGRGGMEKWKHSFSEMTGGLMGKKPKK